MKTLRWPGTVLAIWTAMQVAACESPTGIFVPDDDEPGVENPADTTALAITSVGDLVPGQTARISGTALDQLTQLQVDRVDVEFSVLDVNTAEFTMPTNSTCDVDGRPVEILANGSVRRDGALSIEDVIRLEVGASKILTEEDLSCLQFSSGGETFLLTFASTSPDRLVDSVARIRSPGGSPSVASMSASVAAAPSGAHDDHMASLTPMHDAPLANMQSGEWGTQFDNYADAKVGDVVAMVDWSDVNILYAETRDEVPTYQAKVVAATPTQLILVDQRLDNAADFDTSEERSRFHQAAEMVEAYGVAAVREAVDPTFELPPGAGGRALHVVTAMPPSVAGVPTTEDAMKRGWASGTASTRLTSAYLGRDPGVIAGTIIHEIAHVADNMAEFRQEGKMTIGWYKEAIASLTQDIAARMSMGQELDAPVWEQDNRTHVNTRLNGLPYNAAHRSPFGDPDMHPGTVTYGAYDRGARILRYAMQLYGQRFGSGLSLTQALKERSPEPGTPIDERRAAFGIEAIAEMVGRTPEQLLRESMLADLTDGMVPVAAVAAHSLPQVDGWDYGSLNVAVSRLIGRHRIEPGESVDEQVSVPSGGFDFFYITGEAGAGVSLETTGVDLQSYHQVEVIRLQ